MIRTVLSMVTREGCEDEFVAAWSEFAPLIAEQQGSVAQVMLRDRTRPRRFVIASDWTDEKALERFRKSELRQDLSAALDLLRVSADKAAFDVVATYRGIAEEDS